MPPPKAKRRRKGRGPRWSRVKGGGVKKKKEADEQKLNRYLHSIYFNPRHPGSFKGADKLHNVVVSEKKFQIGKSKIKRWLQQQESYSTHKNLVRKFKRNRVIVGGMYDQYDADLADMQKLKRKNNGVTFLLVVIDVFSRYTWVEPLKNKMDSSVVEGFRKIFSRGKTPKRIRTDRGTEFRGKISQKFFKDESIEHWSSHNQEIKAHFAERVIRTIKSALWSYMRNKKEYRYVDVLQDVVDAYNDTEHRSTEMRPSDVTEGEVERYLWWKLYKPREPYAALRNKAKPAFLYKVGSHVRISHSSKTFERAYDEKWSTEIFIISRRFIREGIKKYKVSDIEGEAVTGSFYEPELQAVKYSEDRAYEIEREISSVGRGAQRRTLVKWAGWPDKFNSWIAESQRVKYLGK